jgi:hypothetical protein
MKKNEDAFATIRIRREVKEELDRLQPAIEQVLGRSITNTDLVAYLIAQSGRVPAEQLRDFVEKTSLQFLFHAAPERQRVHERLDMLLEHYDMDAIEETMTRLLYTLSIASHDEINGMRAAVDLDWKMKQRSRPDSAKKRA